MNRNEAIDYLTRCADDNGNHWYQGRVWTTDNSPDLDTCPLCRGTNRHDAQCPGSRYGHWSSENAEIAYRCARIDDNVTETNLYFWMGLAVNDSEAPQRHIEEHAAELADANVDAMVAGYLECQLWAQTDYDRDQDGSGDPKLDENYDVDDIAASYVDRIRDEFAALVAAHPLAVRMFVDRIDHRGINAHTSTDRTGANEYFGHNYYLTREGHGAGFWDRGLGDLGDYLTDIAKSAGSADDLWDNGNGELTA